MYTHRKKDSMKRIVEIVVIVVLLVILAEGFVSACDSDPAFQGSGTYTGKGGYNAPR